MLNDLIRKRDKTGSTDRTSSSGRQCWINANRGSWQLFARGPLLTRDKDLSKLYACERVDTRQWHEWHSQPLESTRHTIRYDTRCYFNVRSKADISQLNLPHGTDNWKCVKTEKLKSKKTDMLRSNSKQYAGNSNSKHAGNYFVPISIRPIFFYFFCCRSYVKLLDYWRAEKIFSTSEGHLRPEARGICHICPMVNPALSGRPRCREHTKTLRSFVRLTRGSTSDWPRGFCWSFCWILDLIKEDMLNNMVCTRTAFGCWRLTFLQPITWRRFIAAASQLVTSEHTTKPAAVTTRAPDI